MLSGRQRVAVWGLFLVGTAFTWSLRQPGPAPPAPRPVAADAPSLTRPPSLEGPLVRDEVARIATRYGLDPALVQAIIEVESGHDPAAVSAKGAVGLMQVLPETAALLGFPEATDPANNLEAGCRYFAELLAGFGGDVELALAGYNAGPGAVRRWGTVPPFRETRRFVEKVGAAYYRLTGTDLATASRLWAVTSSAL